MSHLDEGTLHALLDGELELNEVAEIQAHLGSCSACGLRLREVKEFLGEADRLIASVELDAPATPVAAPSSRARPEPPPRSTERPHPAEPRPAPREVPPAAWEPWNEQVPVILVPDNESPAERRRRLLQRYGWAAMILILIGAGVIGRLTRPVPMFGPTSAPDTLAGTDSEVVSQEETARPEQPPAQTAETNGSALALQKSKPAAKPATKAPEPSQPLRGVRQEAGRAVAVLAESSRSVDSAADTAAQTTTDSTAVANEADSAGDGTENLAAGGTEDLAVVRQRASEALAQLDREKRRSQAAAATAALDAARRRRGAQTVAPAAAPTPPAPPTPEERAQVYLRIGLDEASRQLGGPAHVIEGMSPLFMGLAQGVVVAGADATRPVVRVVYQDAQGRLIFLDQQRLRAGQASPPASPLSWIQSGTAMWLHGESGPEILRTYRPRVR